MLFKLYCSSDAYLLKKDITKINFREKNRLLHTSKIILKFKISKSSLVA